MIRTLLVATLMSLGAAVQALELALPASARVTTQTVTGPDSHAVPIAAYAGGLLPVVQVEGRVTRMVWRIDGDSANTLQLMAPLRAQITGAGYETLLDCETEGCGGFDFRFGIEVLPAPEMHVSLGDFRFLSARRGAADHLTLLVSRAGNSAHVQLIRVTALDAETAAVAVRVARPLPGTPAGDLAAQLLSEGRAVLTGLDFATGASDLGPGPYASLVELAAFMAGRPATRIALVGHTDTVGGLSGNVTLSRRRAASVMERLASTHGVARSRMEADGVGYLAPVASNVTPEGREANRRVEVVLLDTE